MAMTGENAVIGQPPYNCQDIELNVSMNVQNVKTPLGMLLEECAELISAINRWQRGDTDSISVMEEIADVEIMLEQMKITFDRETIESIKSQKLARLQGETCRETISQRKVS